MSYRIVPTRKFLRELKQLAKRYVSIGEDVEALGISLAENPFQGVDLGGGLRKIRMAITSKGRGKSGGARVITLNVILTDEDGEVFLITIYDKAERESSSVKELEKFVRENGLK